MKNSALLLGALLLAAPGLHAAEAPLEVDLSKACKLVVTPLDLSVDPPTGSCWSFACESGKAVNLGCGLTELMQVAELRPSSDRNWLAVISVGEGHPILEIVDLAKLWKAHEYQAVKTVNPYPGTINLVGWTDRYVIVSSDMALDELPIKNGEPIDHMLPSQRLFRIEIDGWRITPMKAADRQP